MPDDAVQVPISLPAELPTSLPMQLPTQLPIQLGGALADRDSWRATNCSVARALDVVGTRSSMLIMREAFYGASRFEQFARRVGITEAVAAARLRELTEAGLLAKSPYRDPGQRTRFEYQLTDMGRDLMPVLISLMRWGDRYLADEPGGPLRLVHRGCDAAVELELRCAAGHRVGPGELTVSRRAQAPDRASRPDGPARPSGASQAAG